jgi:succinate dehydrogenase / fumarate reductase cytochrome b subunit
MTDVREALMVGRTSDGKRVRRPLSPHLQEYRLPLTAWVSIVHRGTGGALSIGTLLLTWWLVAAAASDRAYAFFSWVFGSWIGYLALLGWTFSLCFHFCSGIRHLAWDAGWGVDRVHTHASTWAVIVCALALTVVSYAIGLATL